MTAPPDALRAPLIDLLLALADDKLFLGHRNSDWTGLGPILEEDIAFSALAQDEIGHAASIYQMIAPWLNHSPDQLAYGRQPDEYRCAAIVELSDDFDWAFALVRQFFCDHFDVLRLERLSHSSYKPLAALAARQLAEERQHVAHADQWLTRLGRSGATLGIAGAGEAPDGGGRADRVGGGDAHARVQSALDRLATHAVMLFEPTLDEPALESAGLYPPLMAGRDVGPVSDRSSVRPVSNRSNEMFAAWKSTLEAIATGANLRLALPNPDFSNPAGRRGVHTDEFIPMLSELTEVYHLEPNGAW